MHFLLTVTFMHGCAQWPYFHALLFMDFICKPWPPHQSAACLCANDVRPPKNFANHLFGGDLLSIGIVHGLYPLRCRTPHLVFQARYLEWEPLNFYLCAFSGAKEFRVFFATNTVPGCLYSRHVEHLHLYAYA